MGVVGRLAACGAPASERLTTSDVLTRLPSRPLKVYDHDRLEGLSLSITDVGPIPPLPYGQDGGGCESGVSFNQSEALYLAGLIHHCLEDDGPLGRARFDGVFRRNALDQPFFRTLGRENDRAALPGQWSIGRSCSGSVLLAVGELVAGLVSLRLGCDRCRWGCGCRSRRRNCRARSRCRRDRLSRNG